LTPVPSQFVLVMGLIARPLAVEVFRVDFPRRVESEHEGAARALLAVVFLLVGAPANQAEVGVLVAVAW
jgi:hypothetical protein